MQATDVRRRTRRVRAIGGSLAAIVLLGACGNPVTTTSTTSIGEALGMDETAFQEREAKVQEAVRKCMLAEGFEYVPADPSQMHIEVRSPGGDDNSAFRSTKGYGITTTIGDRPAASEKDSSDPNQRIREALREEDQEAYDRALFGDVEIGGDGNFVVRVGPGGGSVGDATAGEPAAAPDSAQAGCFGRAQQEVGGGEDELQQVGPELQELEERITSDPRLVKANTAWAACMSEAGFDFEKPEDIPAHLFDKLQELLKSQGGEATGGAQAGGGATVIPPIADSPELAALQKEELALARADDTCSDKTGRRTTARKVRAEAEKQFLEDNPDLGNDGAASEKD